MSLFGDYAANATIDVGAVGQQPGTATNDNASVGNVGEFTQVTVATGSAVSLTTATAADVATVSIGQGGDYDVEGLVTLKYASATQSADGQAGISTTSATLPVDGTEAYNNTRQTTTSSNVSISLPRKRLSLTTNQLVRLVAKATFSAGTCNAFGWISWRRVR